MTYKTSILFKCAALIVVLTSAACSSSPNKVDITQAEIAEIRSVESPVVITSSTGVKAEITSSVAEDYPRSATLYWVRVAHEGGKWVSKELALTELEPNVDGSDQVLLLITTNTHIAIKPDFVENRRVNQGLLANYFRCSGDKKTIYSRCKENPFVKRLPPYSFEYIPHGKYESQSLSLVKVKTKVDTSDVYSIDKKSIAQAVIESKALDLVVAHRGVIGSSFKKHHDLSELIKKRVTELKSSWRLKGNPSDKVRYAFNGPDIVVNFSEVSMYNFKETPLMFKDVNDETVFEVLKELENNMASYYEKQKNNTDFAYFCSVKSNSIAEYKCLGNSNRALLTGKAPEILVEAKEIKKDVKKLPKHIEKPSEEPRSYSFGSTWHDQMEQKHR